MAAILIVLTTVPLAVALLALVLPVRLVRALTVATGLSCFGLAVALVPTVAGRDVGVGFLRADALSLVFVLSTAFLYGAGGAYSIGYLHGGPDLDAVRYARRFYAGLNLFAWSMLAAPLVDGLALLWIAIEITTVVSALLVALDDTDSATEAAWKYVLLASAGLGIGLLATVLMYYAGASVVGQSYDLAFDPLLRAGTVTIVGAAAVHVLVRHGVISPLPLLVAVAASLVRMSFTGRTVVRSLARIHSN